jgi:hypothetical protein
MVVAKSTTETEYLVCSEATREAQPLVYLQRGVTGETADPFIYCDSNGELSTIRSMASSDKTEHIDVASTIPDIWSRRALSSSPDLHPREPT